MEKLAYRGKVYRLLGNGRSLAKFSEEKDAVGRLHLFMFRKMQWVDPIRRIR